MYVRLLHASYPQDFRGAMENQENTRLLARIHETLEVIQKFQVSQENQLVGGGGIMS